MYFSIWFRCKDSIAMFSGVSRSIVIANLFFKICVCLLYDVRIANGGTISAYETIKQAFDGIDIFLNEDEAVRLIGCFMCNKIKTNNWARYCNSECPYYFNTKSLKQIFGLNPIERRELIGSN